MGVVQCGNGARFAFEAFGESFRCDFDGDDTVQSRVAGFVHLAHATRADQGDDFVWAQVGSGCEGHEGLIILPCERH